MAENKFNSKDSLYVPISIEIDEKPYECKKFTRDVMDHYLDFEQNIAEARSEDDVKRINELIYAEVLFLFPKLKKEILDSLHMREVFDIIDLIEEGVAKKKKEPKTEKGKQEKNAKTPGDTKSPS